MPETYKDQAPEDVFALDIGTRSIIGVVGRREGERFHVLAIEQEDHNQRAMLDGQIVNIAQVADVAKIVVNRLEKRLRMKIHRASVAAAGRALKTESAQFKLELPTVQQIGEDLIGQLEAGAVSKAEEIISQAPEQKMARFYMVGYTASQYTLDGYPMTTLKDHSGQVLEADIVATFLPQEVVESLYAVVGYLGLEVASLTLEPIASLNAAIPADIRLLNLVLIDIGAGTSDIAVCRDGSVVGYTMATVAGDETTELLMRSLLVDFRTGERMKMQLDGTEDIRYTDILGMEHTLRPAELQDLVRPSIESLAKEIAQRVMDLNGRIPSAVFLAGGGSKLSGLREAVAKALKLDDARVALAGNQFQRNAFSEEYELCDPGYATPLGIAISAALGMINDSYVVTLNGEPAKLFRSGVLTLRDILLMNGYNYRDLIGRSGSNLSVTVNGERRFYRGAPAALPEVQVNGKPADMMDVAHAGDNIYFIPAQSGEDAEKTVRDIAGPYWQGEAIVNGAVASPEDLVHTGDEIWLDPDPSQVSLPPEQAEVTPEAMSSTPPASPALSSDAAPSSDWKPTTPLHILFNGEPLTLPGKPNGDPYYLMDLLEYSGLDFDHLEKPIELSVNDEAGQFTQVLAENDNVIIN